MRRALRVCYACLRMNPQMLQMHLQLLLQNLVFQSVPIAFFISNLPYIHGVRWPGRWFAQQHIHRVYGCDWSQSFMANACVGSYEAPLYRYATARKGATR